MKDSNSNSKPWRPFTANCCSTDQTISFGNFSRCRPSKSDFSKNIAPLPSFRRLSFSDLSRSSSSRINEDLAQSFGSDLYDFQLSELRAITQNFSSNFLLGEGGFGTVHKGYVDDNMRQDLKPQAVAVKLLDIEGLQGHREWLGMVFYSAIQRVLGVSIASRQIVARRVPRRADCCVSVWLSEKSSTCKLPSNLGSSPMVVPRPCSGIETPPRLLYSKSPAVVVALARMDVILGISICLPWGTRLKIAIGAAKGLAFLHCAEKPVIYRDFKTSNILLDSDFNAKLSDFGLAKMGPEGSNTHVTTRVMGTYGYAAPEYVNTGRRAMDKTRPKSEQHLVDWAKPYLTSSRRLRCIVDPRLAGQYSVKGAKEMALLALQFSCGQWPGSPKSSRNGLLSVKGRRENGGASGIIWKQSPVAANTKG
ncbi:protein kinase superfamily protein [Actinidia rufa]|uniref:Protein kinase superfamily protein n=1 Tax=Actinidia rufa TaxID=165716 RepID=A0A7J0FDG8_9ERIC|nr:protein kinase superfamily protein [Actinidia rufa]